MGRGGNGSGGGSRGSEGHMGSDSLQPLYETKEVRFLSVNVTTSISTTHKIAASARNRMVFEALKLGVLGKLLEICI
ncbi:hypothetical protein Q3G72_032440 [Acer saccharum]|nr:hypothetical protein Q3G72_032440 [Acer saccharum]